jgi:carbohydrate kinase (thermoresistant glucokinase family)
MHQGAAIRSIVVMGVSGSGKSTIGTLLATELDFTFSDGDSLHSPENIATMASGQALTDADREPWLRSVGELLQAAQAQNQGIVVACSALKRAYRETLRSFVPDIFFVFLDGTAEVVQKRIAARNHEFMPQSLLASQFANLEPLKADEQGFRVDIKLQPQKIVDEIIENIEMSQSKIKTT